MVFDNHSLLAKHTSDVEGGIRAYLLDNEPSNVEGCIVVYHLLLQVNMVQMKLNVLVQNKGRDKIIARNNCTLSICQLINTVKFSLVTLGVDPFVEILHAISMTK